MNQILNQISESVSHTHYTPSIGTSLLLATICLLITSSVDESSSAIVTCFNTLILYLTVLVNRRLFLIWKGNYLKEYQLTRSQRISAFLLLTLLDSMLFSTAIAAITLLSLHVYPSQGVP